MYQHVVSRTLSLVSYCIMCRRGSEEEYTELTQLLEDVSSYMGDIASLQKKVRDAKSLESKQKAKEMKAVMDRLLSTSTFCGISVSCQFCNCRECILSAK